jgi:hypothetical protein
MAVTATSAMVATTASSSVFSKKAKEESENSSHCLPFSSSFPMFLVLRRSPELAFALVGREVLITCEESKQMIQQLILFH